MTFRKVHIDGKVWEYYVGKWHVVIRYDDIKKIVSFKTITKSYSWQHVPVTPGLVKEYIESNKENFVK